MSAPDRPNLPAKLDPAALERVLARAAELQAATGEPTEELSEAQLVELGREVGLSESHLRQALAEERTRAAIPHPTGGPLARSFGDARVSATRTVAGRPASLLQELDGWMQRQECLQVKRFFPDRIVWEARRDFVGAIRRGFNLGGRGYALARAHDVSATVVPLDDRQVLVRLDADLSSARTGLARETLALTGIGWAGGTVAAVLGVMVPVAVVPAVALVGAGYFQARRRFDAVRSRTQLTLEQVLDRLERGELARGASLLDVLAAAASSVPRR